MVLLWCTGVTRLPTRTGRQNQCEQQRHFAYVFSTRKNTRFFFTGGFFPTNFWSCRPLPSILEMANLGSFLFGGFWLTPKRDKTSKLTSKKWPQHSSGFHLNYWNLIYFIILHTNHQKRALLTFSTWKFQKKANHFCSFRPCGRMDAK